MDAQLVTRHRIVVSCDSCHAQLPVAFTLTDHGTTPDGALHLHVDVDPPDRVMGALFRDAHRGPFTKEPTR